MRITIHGCRYNRRTIWAHSVTRNHKKDCFFGLVLFFFPKKIEEKKIEEVKHWKSLIHWTTQTFSAGPLFNLCGLKIFLFSWYITMFPCSLLKRGLQALQQKHWDRWRCEREKTEARKTLPTITRLVLYPMCKTEKRIHHNAENCLSPSLNGFWQENKSLGCLIYFIFSLFRC